jgi:hypothetical protein
MRGMQNWPSGYRVGPLAIIVCLSECINLPGGVRESLQERNSLKKAKIMDSKWLKLFEI